jgi:hypothetical protein
MIHWEWKSTCPHYIEPNLCTHFDWKADHVIESKLHLYYQEVLAQAPIMIQEPKWQDTEVPKKQRRSFECIDTSWSSESSVVQCQSNEARLHTAIWPTDPRQRLMSQVSIDSTIRSYPSGTDESQVVQASMLLFGGTYWPYQVHVPLLQACHAKGDELVSC